MRRVLLFAMTVCLTACGPLSAPAFRRLPPDQQEVVNGMWNNMLSNPDRLDRELLLDVLLTFELHQVGIDKATYHAEKNFTDGLVCMDISFDRQRPLEDWFIVEILDKKSQLVRRERYTGEEIRSHVRSFTAISPQNAAGAEQGGSTLPHSPVTQPASQPTDAEARQRWMQARLQQIIAATQPAK